MSQKIRPVDAAALARAIPKSQLGSLESKIRDGTSHDFDFTVRIRGTLSRGDGGPMQPTCTLLNEAVFAATMLRLGVDEKRWHKEMLKVATDAHVKGVDVASALTDKHPELLVSLHKLKQKVVKKLPPLKRRGSIKVDATVEVREGKRK